MLGLVADHGRRRLRRTISSSATAVFVPFVELASTSRYGWYVLLFLIVAGAANGVNLTDGLDGLAAGTGIIALFTFTAMAVIVYIRSGTPAHGEHRDAARPRDHRRGPDRGAIGFLWFNAFPAEVFMGDTGSMVIGGALAGVGDHDEDDLLLLLVGGIFVIEALSVMLQVLSFKYWGRRVFLMAPIHHHFEMKAWSETKIMVRFWIVDRRSSAPPASPSTTATTRAARRDR